MEAWTPSFSLPSSGGWAERYTDKSHPTNVTEPPNLAATSVDLGSLENVDMTTAPLTISHAQAEACVVACRALQTPPFGFCLGDGTGVGKCRTLAAIAMERTVCEGSFAIWVTTSRALCGDICTEAGHVFGYAAAREWCNQLHEEDRLDGRVFVITYRAATNELTSSYIMERLAHAGANGTIIFDEAHTGRNKDSNVGRTVRAWQDDSPLAGVIYSTATAASCARRMSYMSRLGMWGIVGSPFVSDTHFISAMSGGTASLELVGMHMKRTGRYLARELGVMADKVSTIKCLTSDDEKQVYEACGKFCDQCKANMSQKLSLFGRLILAFKVRHACERAHAHVAAGRRVLVSLLLTGESVPRNGQRSAIASTLECILNAGEFSGYTEQTSAAHELERIISMLPPDPLSALREHLACHGVSLLTGGKGGRFAEDVAKFQDGTNRTAILSGAASSGICLHDVGDPVPAPRVHIMLQVPWSPESFAQQTGRSCRSGQVSLPQYELLVTDIPSEARWTYSLTKKMKSMGAITRGDESATFVAGGMLGGGDEDTVSPSLVSRVAVVRAGRHACLKILGDQSYCTVETESRQRPSPCPPVHCHDLIVRGVVDHSRGQQMGTREASAMMRAIISLEMRTVAGGIPGPGECTIPHAEWVPGKMKIYNRQHQSEIMNFMLVANRHQVQLPMDIVCHICSLIVGDDAKQFGTDLDAYQAVSDLRNRHEMMSEGFHEDLTSLFNTTLSMSLAQQKRTFRLIHQAQVIQLARGSKQERTMNLRRYVLPERIGGMSVRATLGGEVSRHGIQGIHPLSVTVTYSSPVDMMDEWSENGRLLATGTSWQGSAFAIVASESDTRVDRQVQLWYPGRSSWAHTGRSVDSIISQWQTQCSDLSSMPSATWVRLWRVQRDDYIAKKRRQARSLSRVIHVATRTALANWEVSRKRVLRCTPPEVERSFTCLVVR